VKSHDVMREAAEKVGVKALAAKLNLSTAMVYKWCQEAAKDDPASSGARNPLDRMKEIFDITQDPKLINWLCNSAGGFFVQNPATPMGSPEGQLLGTTQRVVEDFGELLTAVSSSIENDGQILPEEADRIRQVWESLKTEAERFVVACERGIYNRKRK
jgi:regulatory protein CII